LVKKIIRWFCGLKTKYQAKTGIAFLEKYHLRKELDEMIDFALDTFPEDAPLILAEFLQFVKEYKNTFDSEEDYARWLGWQIKQYKGTMLQWAQGQN